MNPIDRRHFIRTSTCATAAAILSARSYGAVRGANQDLRIAVVGLNGRGRNHIQGFSELPNVRVVALCDVDTAILEREARRAKEQGLSVETFVDYRELLQREDIDAVSIATPNHQHAIQAIWACQAGKDVYLEKPVSHNIWEGSQIVKAAQKTGRIVAAGTQCRSSYALAESVAWVNEGHIGKIKLARGLCYKPRQSIGKLSGPIAPPDTVDYNLWLGPAPMEAVHRKRFHYDWHWQWPYGNGDLGNQGIHQMDIARWYLGESRLAPNVSSFGGRLGYEDDGNTPNTMVSMHEYEKAPLFFEVRGLPSRKGSENMDSYLGSSIGVIIHCEGGFVVVPGYANALAYTSDGTLLKTWEGANNHYANFANAVINREPESLAASIQEGHISSALCHAGNLSLRLGSPANPSSVAEQLHGDKFASEALDRARTHLERNQVDFDLTPFKIGAHLSIDTAKEKFTGQHATEANALLSREYREGFSISV